MTSGWEFGDVRFLLSDWVFEVFESFVDLLDDVNVLIVLVLTYW